VAAGDPGRRSIALRFAAGIATVQVYWAIFQFFPESWLITTFIIGMFGELLVPIFAERSNHTPWHPHHIAERYGLFTMIVLGESILASSLTIVDAIEEAEHYGDLIAIALTAFVIVAGMWWIYFSFDQSPRLGSLRTGLKWSYGHYLIFVSAAAVSAGIEVAVDYSTGHTELDEIKAAATMCLPVAAFILGAWLVLIRPNADALVNRVTPMVAGFVLLAALVPFSLQVVATLVVALAVLITIRSPDGDRHGAVIVSDRSTPPVARWVWAPVVTPAKTRESPRAWQVRRRPVRVRPQDSRRSP
jgi:low temperature requirement protein LtrA